MLKRTTNREPSLPGQILHQLYLKRGGITIKAFAEAVGVTPKHMSNIIHGKSRIEAELATRMAMVLGTTAELWLNLQNELDLYHAQQKIRNWRPKQIFDSSQFDARV